MTVGLLCVEIHLPESNSLKAKRMILRSIKDKLRHDFNVSVAEIGSNDKWQRALLGIATVSNDRKFANNVLNKIVDKLRYRDSFNIIDYTIELL
ncbi:MAG: DUF503 family protein [candidate division Zixibacteria bacterium]|nr:DUF503 family protein [candidate division Zixibacteria bacterium]